jgi:NADH-quinone oxidoreductase subunit M
MHVLAVLCLGNILYVGLVALRQKDFQLLIGNASVAHMGFAFLGMASLSVIGVTGTVVIMVAHGFLAALTFAVSGYLYQQTRTSSMAQMGGFLRSMPFIGACLVAAAFAACGLPGFANFVGEVMVFFGAWKGARAITALAVWGALVIGAVYMLRAVRSILHGPVSERWVEVRDADNPWRRLPFVLLLASLLLFGILPRLLTDRARPSVAAVLAPVIKAADNAAPLSTAQATGRQP